MEAEVMSRGPMEVGAGSAPECVVLVFISVLSRSTPEIDCWCGCR